MNDGFPGTSARLWMVASAFQRHGRYGSALITFLLGPVALTLDRFFLWMDRRLVPALRTATLDRPVIIMGHPRSGTSFFQRQVARSGTAGMFRTWEIALPSLVLRRLVTPFLRAFTRFRGDVAQSGERGHRILIHGVEEDEGLFIHRLDTEILTYLCPWLLTDPRYSEIGLRLGLLSRRERLRSIRFYRAMLKRQVVATGHSRLVLKSNPMVFRLPELLEAVPDARVVYVVRSPVDCVRSYLAFTHRFARRRLTRDELRVFHRRKYEWSRAFYRAFDENRSAIPEGQLLVLPFHRIVEQPLATLEEFFEFAGLEPAVPFRRSNSRRQRQEHRKRHANRPLAHYDVSPAEIRRDLAFVWDHFGLPEED